MESTVFTEREVEEVRGSNPEFSRLLDIISSTHEGDGLPKATRSQLKQAELRLRVAEQRYLEQLLFNEELKEAVHSQSKLKAEETPAAASSAPALLPSCKPRPQARPSDFVTASAELQHCLELAPDVPLLGLQVDHLRAVAMEGNVPSSTLQECVAERLKSRCCQVVQWHAPHKDPSSSSSDVGLKLARASQLPQLLTQQKEEVETFQKQLLETRRECEEMIVKKHRVSSELCAELKHALEEYKLSLSATANQAALDYLQAQSQAMLGKLDVMHHQLLKGICSDGRVEALQQIKSHLLTAQKQLTEEVLQTQHVLLSYRSLGEDFTALNQQYHELREEIENRQWALRELRKSHTATC